MAGKDTPTALGLDFGTTNTVVALADGNGSSDLVEFSSPGGGADAVFRSALCFWEDEKGWNGIAHEARPWAIEEYLQSSLDSPTPLSSTSKRTSSSAARLRNVT